MMLLSRLLEIRQRGIASTLVAAMHRIISMGRRCVERWDDWVNGTDTAGIVETADLTVASPNKDRGIRYQPTPARPLRKLMRALQIPPGQVFADIGSGKGRVLIIALRLGFKKIVGVEYATDLCDIAQKNLATARRNIESPAIPVVIHCCDAAEYGFDEGETVIYLFNPFDATVLAQMLARLAASIARAPRKVWLIYHFPRWYDVIESHGLFAPSGVHRYGNREFAIYIYDPLKTPRQYP